MKNFVAANWKMNGALSSHDEVKKIADYAQRHEDKTETILCVPFVYITSFLQKGIAIGGQDCHHEISGAYTGDISAAMLQDINAKYVIIGHSERREYHNEMSELVARKAIIAHEKNIKTILCIGEDLATYKAGNSKEFVLSQLKASLPDCANDHNTIIAYEPIWAIGTGLTPTISEISDIHQAIYDCLMSLKGGGIANEMRILYGGSVKSSNAKEIATVSHLHGALVGGASLTSEAFCPIIEAFSR